MAGLFFSMVPQLDSIDLHSLCGPVISKTVWGSLACSESSGGLLLIIRAWRESLQQSRGSTFKIAMCTKGPPGWKCKSILALGQTQAHTPASHIPSQTFDFLAYSDIMFVFRETCTKMVRWVAWCAAESTAVRIKAVAHMRLQWQTVTGPTSLSLPLTLFPSSISLYFLHPSLVSPITKICIHFGDALWAWQITMMCCQGKMLLTLYLSLHPSPLLPLLPYENVVLQFDLICFIGIEVAQHCRNI